MLITFSGMVGSGKSTAGKHVAGVLAAAGVPCHYVRFRTLGITPFKSSSDKRGAGKQVPNVRVVSRASGFQLRRLTAAITCGYLARMLAFRWLGPSRTASEWFILDRYFYDSFVHYGLGTRRERLYAMLLQRVMPVPDIAVLLVASSETIAARRPDYAPEYISLAGRGYGRLRARFPELIEIRTDRGEPVLGRLERLVLDRLVARGLQTVASREG